MSLEELYYGNFSGSSSDDSFNPEDSLDSDESDDELDEAQGPSSSKAVPEENQQEKIKKIDDIWNEMNTASGQAANSGFTGKGKGRFIETEASAPEATDSSKIDVKQNLEKNSITVTNKNLPDSKDELKRDRQEIENDNSKKQKLVKPVARKPSKFSQIEAEVGASFKKKLNTVEQSKMKWDKLVEKEDIKAELQNHNKDGYVEKLEFIDRVNDQKNEYIQTLKKP
ncbi:SWR1-complex protein 5 [Smittium culicis]|uniref:SWR1-complex protein 5 n=1 Tax=Smittium culicis TaxID=133412 RepID=A0A1R1YB51_9FUNG|nr:SWR1-complex protein 5 [Smittium culicis]